VTVWSTVSGRKVSTAATGLGSTELGLGIVPAGRRDGDGTAELGLGIGLADRRDRFDCAEARVVTGYGGPATGAEFEVPPLA